MILYIHKKTLKAMSSALQDSNASDGTTASDIEKGIRKIFVDVKSVSQENWK
jgi:hypothetical protein